MAAAAVKNSGKGIFQTAALNRWIPASVFMQVLGFFPGVRADDGRMESGYGETVPGNGMGAGETSVFHDFNGLSVSPADETGIDAV